MFIPKPYHLRTLWWKLRPPPIPSPYLLHPRFARELKQALSKLSKDKRAPIEFGCLYGWTTHIIATSIPISVRLVVYDTFQRVSVERVKANVNSENVIFIYANIWHWLQAPPSFDFLYVDVNNTEVLIKELWTTLREQIRNGAIILFEGSTRMRLNIPHKKIVLADPGLGQLLP